VIPSAKLYNHAVIDIMQLNRLPTPARSKELDCSKLGGGCGSSSIWVIWKKRKKGIV